jgi:hypothetical protein
MAEARELGELEEMEFSPPALSGDNCADMLALSKHKLFVSMDRIASKNKDIHKGWFGKLPDQKLNGKTSGRQARFPVNYQRLEKWLTEDCNCSFDQSMSKMNEDTAWDSFKSVYNAMKGVASEIQDSCPRASTHITKKLGHAWNFLVRKDRKAHLKLHFKATDFDTKRRRK